MATKNNGITRADAIAFAMERCTDNPDVVEVLAKLHKQFTTRKQTTGPTKARIENENLARKVRDAILASDLSEGVSSKWIVDNVPVILTTQKATAVARTGVDMDILTKVTIPHGSRNTVLYTVK